MEDYFIVKFVEIKITFEVCFKLVLTYSRKKNCLTNKHVENYERFFILVFRAHGIFLEDCVNISRKFGH